MDTAKPYHFTKDVRMLTAKGWGDDVQDIRMETAKGYPETSRPTPLKLWEREQLETPEVKRKATVAQLCQCACIPSQIV
jgi:hypothetical protein